jgi:hypothetical protein
MPPCGGELYRKQLVVSAVEHADSEAAGLGVVHVRTRTLTAQHLDEDEAEAGMAIAGGAGQA